MTQMLSVQEKEKEWFQILAIFLGELTDYFFFYFCIVIYYNNFVDNLNFIFLTKKNPYLIQPLIYN